MKFILLFAMFFPCLVIAQDKEIGVSWQDWSPAVFEVAKKERKLVLLEVGAGWCHWCHVMDQSTYSDPHILEQLRQHYVTVRVDQDSHPDLSRRYENYGWPATVIFNEEGTEIAKRRGYIDPTTMTELLKESFDNPKPHLHQTASYPTSGNSSLSESEHDLILTSLVFFYDDKDGGWGDNNKFLEADVMQFALMQAEAGNRPFKRMSTQSLDASFALIDPAWGGIYQYSDSTDWKSPHFEKLLSVQADYLQSYAYAARVFKEPKYQEAATKVIKYLDAFMTSADGAFYTSQDADVSEAVTGHIYYAADDAGRRRLGMPRVDKHVYASDNGYLISSLLVQYEMTGDKTVLEKSLKAANWVVKNRSLPEGGFGHGEHDKDGPFLSDTLGMSKAMLDLYAATGERAWLGKAAQGGQFIKAHFADPAGNGFFTAQPQAGNVLKPYKNRNENILAARFFNLLSVYGKDKEDKTEALFAMRYVASPDLVQNRPFSAGTLLADSELRNPPLHLTIVGAKDDPKAMALFKTALSFPSLYKQTEWLDKREGKLPNSDIDYPDLPNAAAFICNSSTCSLPISEPQALAEKAEQLRLQN